MVQFCAHIQITVTNDRLCLQFPVKKIVQTILQVVNGFLDWS